MGKLRRLKLGETFLSYKAMVETWFHEQLETPDSEFKKMEKEMKAFDETFVDTIYLIKEEDSKRNLFTLEERPTSLMEYPHFGGKDTQCYFRFEEKNDQGLAYQ